METDRRQVKKDFRGIGLKVAEVALVISAIPLSNPGNTVRVFEGAFLDRAISCAPEPNPKNPQLYPFDAIVVPGAGSIKLSKGVYEPNVSGQIRLSAAAIAFAQGYAPEIIILDGRGSKGISEGNKAYLEKAFKDYTGRQDGIIPEKALKWDKKSLNTSENMQELSGMKKKEHLRRVLNVTSRFHAQRANQLGCEYGIGITSHAGAGLDSAEDFVIQANPENEIDINRLYLSRQMRHEELKEHIELVASLIDPKSVATITLKRLQTDFDAGVKGISTGVNKAWGDLKYKITSGIRGRAVE